MVRIGLVGCGAIGGRLAKEIQNRFRGIARLSGICDDNPKAAQRLKRQLRTSVPILSPSRLIRRSDLLIEAASAKAVSELLPKAIAARRAMMVMSTGGLLRRPQLLREAAAARIPVYLPSGALVGLDGIKAAAVGTLRRVTLTTRKPPRAFSGAPGVARRRIDLNRIRTPRVLFQGSAEKAVAAFPQNVNVAATLSLAGIGAKRTYVRVIADPTIRENLHELEAVGSFGKLAVRTENRPSQENPKTSRLAVLSAIATLRQVLNSVKVGT